MPTFKIVMMIIAILIVLLMFYALIYNKIKTQILKINSAENEIDESLRMKYDLILKLVTEIKQILENNKDFDDMENLKDENISSFEFERKLIDYESKIYNIKANNNKLSKNPIFNDIWYQINNLNTKIIGEEKYYNENTTTYNNLVSKFPSNIIAIIMRYKEKKYFDGKDMYDKNIKDFKI